MKLNYKTPLIISLMLVVGMIAGFRLSRSYESDTKISADKKIEELLGFINRNYVDKPDNEKLSEAAINAILKELDPHSVYIPARELKESNEELEGNFEGIGVEFNLFNDTILVVAPISGGPSEQAGIHAGDKIIKIDNKVSAGVRFTNEDVFKHLRGKKGTKVLLGIKRGNDKNLMDFTITRDRIPIYSIDAHYMVTPEIGYIKVNRFAGTTMHEFAEAMKDLKNNGMKKLILDLRGNPGGYLEAAIAMADEFLSDKKLIVYTQGRNQKKKTSFAHDGGDFEKGRLAVLIDEGSASASEIVSGAIQDHDRGIIIGTRSFGKGLVQQPFALADGSAIRLTIARYYTPAGRCIQRPYDKGSEDYYMEVSGRLRHGELFNKDSIKNNDSLKFKTDKGRTVYGGGGISPDVFVPVDTSSYSPYLQKLFGKGLFSEFVIDYMQNHRDELKAKYPDMQSFAKGFSFSENMFATFVNLAESKGIKRDAAGLKTSSGRIKTELTALIGRQLYTQDAFWYIHNTENASYKKGINILESREYNLED